MHGLVTSYRKGPKTQKSQDCILRFQKIKSSKQAASLIGRRVGWPVGSHKLRGKIIALHGKNGLVRARFTKGVPGQALGTLVELIG